MTGEKIVVNRETLIEQQLEKDNDIINDIIASIDDGSEGDTSHIIICGNINDKNVLSQIKKYQPSLIVTSPPYNADIKYDNYNDSITIDEYLSFIDAFLNSSDFVLKEGGRIIIDIRDIKIASGSRYPIIVKLYETLCTKLGYKFRGNVIWYKGRNESSNAWGSWMSSANPSIIDLFEYLYIFQKSGEHNRGEDNISKEEFVESVIGVWRIPPVKKMHGSKNGVKNSLGHPAPYPIELPYRAIKLYSNVRDTVLDPFAGIGSTAIAAFHAGRNSISVDISEKYCELSVKRLENEGASNIKYIKI